MDFDSKETKKQRIHVKEHLNRKSKETKMECRGPSGSDPAGGTSGAALGEPGEVGRDSPGGTTGAGIFPAPFNVE